MHEKIPDFNDTELWVIRQPVTERFRKQVELQSADAELRLDPSDRELTLCPVVYWREDRAQLVIFKTGEQAYRDQFFTACVTSSAPGATNTPTSANA
jgi:hypothetical protein